MFWNVLKFELTYRFRRPVVYIFAGLFFLLAFSAIATDSMQMGQGIGNAARNSPFEVVNLLSMMSVMGLLALTGFVATAVNRDYEYRTSEFFFSTPAGKGAYLMGRFLGSLVAAMVAVCAAALGIMLASLMPWLDPGRILPFSPMPYLYSLGVFVLPNLFFAGALLFTFATLTRRVLYTYVAMIAFLLLWIISQELTRDLDVRFVASLLDPFGKTSLDLATRYWTVTEKNTLLPSLTGAFVLNRLLWTGVGAGFLLLAWARFRMAVAESSGRPRGAQVEGGRARTAAPPVTARPDYVPALAFTRRARVLQWLHETGGEMRAIFTSVPFVVIAVIGMLNFVGSLLADFEGTSSYPLTRRMLSSIDGTYTLFLFLLVVIYAAQLVWRERGASMHEIHGALPVPDWLPATSKLSALVAVQWIALAAAIVAAIGYQAASGYFNFEIGLYLRWFLLVQTPAMFMMAALAIGAQVLTGNRLAGYGVMILFFVGREVAPSVSFEHNLLLYAKYPYSPYSDMNGYGHFVQPLFWFQLYWGLAAAALVVLSVLFWVRGTDTGGRIRWREALRRATRPRVATLALLVVGLVATGGWIFYNTNVLNEYTDSRRQSRQCALYEQRYKQYDGLPQPRVTDVNLAVDVYPGERRVEIRGDLGLVNKTDDPIRELHVVSERHLKLTRVSLPDEWLTVDDEPLGYRIYTLQKPLAPGDTLDFEYEASIVNRGFVNGYSNTRVVGNGTFLETGHVVPHFGYTPDGELAAEHERRKYGLPPKEGAAPPDDPVALGTTFTSDADWVTYEATLSTSADQIALTAGYLEREWEEGGRRYFHYTMNEPILHFYPFISGRYEVARDRWDDVEICVYHHTTHSWNVGRMIEAVKRSLDYYTANFGPYQHRQISIVEFPRYEGFAQSFSTMIPYSESAHFVDDLRDEEALDVLFHITAHEVAHQWWGHQVSPALAQGAEFIAESFAQYSSLMVMEKDCGREKMEKFLAYELDRYLAGRAQAREEELPLVLVESQPYIYYRKGSLATYALRDYIGEERMNAALREYVERNRLVGPPYPNSIDLVETLREATPDEYDYLIEDMFETITLYDNRTEAASFEEIGDEKYRVAITVESRKMRADGRGVETEVSHNDWIEIGVYGDEGDEGDEPFLYLEKHRLDDGTTEVEVVVKGKPTRAGIDPRHILIDRVPDDNTTRVAG